MCRRRTGPASLNWWCMSISERWCAGVSCCDPVWEEAYRRFESPEREIRKFRRRLITVGAQHWPRDANILEVCCGRGNGLKALATLGFMRLSGVDLSETLLEGYDGPARLYVGDCRDLRLADGSINIVIVQGGLHHLPHIPADLDMTLREIQRVLRPDGLFVAVEPWNTTFLRMVHTCCGSSALRRWDKLDALATMIERERPSYEGWLSQGQAIRCLLHARFRPAQESTAWGKLTFVGHPLPT